MEGKGQLKCRIKGLYELRMWERRNLPISQTNAGYHLFLYLSKTLLSDSDIRLKNIYHSLPFSEKTLRILLRDLEGNGWIEMPNKSNDPRHKDIIPTPKLRAVLKSWTSQVDVLFSNLQN